MGGYLFFSKKKKKKWGEIRRENFAISYKYNLFIWVEDENIMSTTGDRCTSRKIIQDFIHRFGEYGTIWIFNSFDRIDNYSSKKKRFESTRNGDSLKFRFVFLPCILEYPSKKNGRELVKRSS